MLGTVFAFILFFQGAPGVRTGGVAGQLKSIDGAPATAIRVSVIPAPGLTVRPSDGGEYYYRQPAVSTALTDNQGRYRLTNIPPGRYLLVSGETYHPTTLDADRATILTVMPDSTLENMDFQLLRPVGGKVSGRITPKPEDTRTQQKAILSGINLQEILEVPVGAEGDFECGHVPTGTYLIDLVPPFPGLGASRVEVGNSDVSELKIVRPPTHAVTGRIVVEKGPLPRAFLAFSTPQSYVEGTINPDGTFTARLHSAQHRVELAGMPVGYSVVSVRVGSQNGSETVAVGNSDLSNVVITVSAPRDLPHVRGRITGLANTRLSSTKAQLTGPIVGSLETAIRPDGSFEFPAVTPGMYRLTLSQVPELKPVSVVVTWRDAETEVVVPGR